MTVAKIRPVTGVLFNPKNNYRRKHSNNNNNSSNNNNNHPKIFIISTIINSSNNQNNKIFRFKGKNTVLILLSKTRKIN